MHDDFFVEDKEQYIQFNDFYRDNEAQYMAFINDLKAHYAGYTAMFCYHDAPPPEVFFKSIHAECVDDCVKAKHDLHSLVSGDADVLKKVGADAFHVFSAVHDRKHPDMYWTSGRIYSHLHQWTIFMLEANYVLMSHWGKDAEIFVLEASDSDSCRRLLSACICEAYHNGNTSVLYMIDRSDFRMCREAEQAGFSMGGYYKGYTLVL